MLIHEPGVLHAFDLVRHSRNVTTSEANYNVFERLQSQQSAELDMCNINESSVSYIVKIELEVLVTALYSQQMCSASDHQ